MYLYGDDLVIAVIDSEGGIIFFNTYYQRMIRKMQPRINFAQILQFDHVFLPNNVKPIKISCSQHFVFAIDSNGRLYESALYIFAGGLRLNEVSELKDIKIIDVSVSNMHCLVVSGDERVFAFGLFNPGITDSKNTLERLEHFTEITSLRNCHICAVSTSQCYSLFRSTDGKILACGSNSCNELFLKNGPCNVPIYKPIETIVTSGASFCIAGSSCSAVFMGIEPPNGPNKIIKYDEVRNDINSNNNESNDNNNDCTQS